MLNLVTIAGAVLALASADAGEFQLRDTTPPKGAKGKTEDAAKHPSKIEPTKTEAAMHLFVVDKDKGPIKGIVICLSTATGKYCTEETGADGYGEVLVPVGQKYDVTYLSLGRKDIEASVNVTSEPKQNVKLTLRYKPRPPAKPFILTGIVFDTGKAVLKSESYDKLDVLLEYMQRKRSAKVEISGHTDNAGKPKANKTLSEARAEACRAYLVKKGIDGARIKAAGYGQERPIASNDTEEGRAQNRRIEAIEILPPP
jgi:outer membrane protein OmpA-like peptidoglycan-associated protein